jgi:hypothetical protein
MLFGKSKIVKENTEELRSFIPNVNSTFDFDKLRNFIKSSCEKYIKPILGKITYDYLVAYYESGTLSSDQGSGSGSGSGSGGSSTEKEEIYKNLLQKCQYALASISFFHGFHLLNIKFGDSGVFVDQDEKKRGTYKYEETEVKNSFKEEGYNAIDIILEFLEENKAIFTDWVASDSYTLTHGHFINSANEFNKYYSRINSSRLVFLNLIPFMQIVEDFNILPAIGRAYYDELKDQINKDNISADNLIIINKLRYALAHLSIWKSIDELAVNIADKGVFFYGMASVDKQADLTTPVNNELLNQLKSNAYRNGINYIQYAKDILDNSADDKYPTYKASINFVSGGSTTLLNSTNKKTFRS